MAILYLWQGHASHGLTFPVLRVKSHGHTLSVVRTYSRGLTFLVLRV